MSLRLATCLVLTALLAACSSTAPQPAPAGDPATPAVADAAACTAQGGELRPLGRLQRMQCVVPYADAGKACSSKRDCQGQCLGSTDAAAGVAATGTCQRDISENFGCRQRIDNGQTQGTICVD